MKSQRILAKNKRERKALLIINKSDMNAHSFRFLLPLSELSMCCWGFCFSLFRFSALWPHKTPKSVLHNLCALLLSFFPEHFPHACRKVFIRRTKAQLSYWTPWNESDDVTGHAISVCTTTHTHWAHIHREAYPVTHTNICCLYCWHEHKLLRTHSKLANCQLVKIFEYIPHIQHILLYPPFHISTPYQHVVHVSILPCQVPEMRSSFALHVLVLNLLLIISFFFSFCFVGLNAKTMSDADAAATGY